MGGKRLEVWLVGWFWSDSGPAEVGEVASSPHSKVLISQVEKDDTNVAPVVCVDHSCADVDALLEREPGAWCHASVGAGWDGDGDVGLDELPILRRMSVV